MTGRSSKNCIIGATVLLCATAVLNLNSVEAADPVQMCTSHLENVLKRIGSCDSVHCSTSLNEQTCIDMGAVYQEGAQLCGCCPGCVKYDRGYLAECDDIEGLSPEYDPTCTARECPIIANQCKPGLRCTQKENAAGETKYVCLPDIIPGADCKGHCFIKRAVVEYENQLYGSKPKRQIPDCTADGYFNPKQCKGTRNQGDCYCVDKCGKRIFGRELYGRADNQTCACSRQAHHLRTEQNRIATLHCTESGDYEPLQCDTDSALCYCVNPATGVATGAVLPEHQWKSLPCFDPDYEHNAVDGQYLRVCESEWVAGQKISREALLHGLQFDARPLECDYDGSFAHKLRDTSEGIEQCVHKGGDQIGANRRVYRLTPIMDCNCARDSAYYPMHGINFYIDCDTGSGTDDKIAIGSYKIYYVSGNAYCVDADGHRFGPDVPSEHACCLGNTCIPGYTGCANAGGKYPFKECLNYYLGREDDYSALNLITI